VIVEIKAVEQIAPTHRARVLSYLRFSGCKDGICRFIMSYSSV
jgi:GxxExxY protein